MGFQELESGCIGHFDHGSLSFVNQSKPGIYLPPEGIMGLYRNYPALLFFDDQRSGTVAPVGNRKIFMAEGKSALFQSGEDGISCFFCSKTIFKCIGCNEYMHDLTG